MAIPGNTVRNWAILAAAAASTASSILLFWPAPPTGSENQHFGTWMIAALLAVFIPLFRHLYSSRDTTRWAIATGVALVCSFVVFFSYSLQRQHALAYPPDCGVKVIGTRYKPYVEEFMKHNPDCTSKECLLENAQCDATIVWTESSIEQNKTKLTCLYLLGFPLFAACMFSAAQTLSCAVPAKINQPGEKTQSRS